MSQNIQAQQSAVNPTSINGGRFDFDDGGTYCGGWHEGKAHGHGICTGPKGQGEYSGSWHFGFEVSGVYKWPSGATYEGQWQNGKRHGIGVEYRGKWVYKGEWTQGYKGRYGVRSSVSSSAKYEGTWANGLQDGYGSETYADGGTYQGQWLRGMRHGYGVRSSAAYGHFHVAKTSIVTSPNTISDSLQSLDTEGETHIENKRDNVRGGFVLVARQSLRQRRRNSLVEKTSFKQSLLKGLRLKKQRSTGDIDIKSNRSGTASVASSTESGISTSYKDTDQDAGSNASFLSQDGDISDPSTTETYMGEWKNDKRCGFGICERSDGLRYEGEWYNNKKYGYGVTIFKDGTREEGKYKNNQLVTNVRKKHLFVIRSTKVRERIESAVLASHRAQQIALQKADIAISRTATARGKSEQADFAASAAREDSQLAYITAKQYGGADITQPHSLEAPLRRRLSDFHNIRRNTKELHHNIAQHNQTSKQYLNPTEPFGGRRGSFRNQQQQQQQQHQQHQHQQFQQQHKQDHHPMQSPHLYPQHYPPHYPMQPQDPFSDHFDQYKVLMTKHNLNSDNRNKQANDQQFYKLQNKLVNKIGDAYLPHKKPFDEQTPDSGISIDECLNPRPSGLAMPQVINHNKTENDSSNPLTNRTQQQQWRTASLYKPTAAQSTGNSSSGSSGFKRKPSLQPNVVKQVNKPIMTREEASVLSHQQREQRRIESEMAERMAKNPFLYLFNPRFKAWLSRQQLVMLVLVINISLAIFFFKLLI